MAITRNASEALETLIFGIDLEPGDEVIVTNQNYPRMLTSWDQRARREGIVVKPISFPVPPSSAADVVERFRRAITPRTRVIEFTHITNLTGQILPVREIVRLGRERGHRGLRRRRARVRPLPVHARRPRVRLLRDEPAQVAPRADRHGVPLRPQGEAEEDLAAHGGAGEAMDEDIRKYEEIGTHPAANHNAIAVALAFHRGDRRRARRPRGCATCATAGPGASRPRTPREDPGRP